MEFMIFFSASILGSGLSFSAFSLSAMPLSLSKSLFRSIMNRSSNRSADMNWPLIFMVSSISSSWRVNPSSESVTSSLTRSPVGTTPYCSMDSSMA